MDPQKPCTIARADFRGWQAAYLTNGLVRVAAVPDIGGRLMAYDLGDYSYLFVDPELAGKLFTAAENQGRGELADWKNYGGDKTWPAPQGWDGPAQWPGPPDAILDTGRYHLADLASTDDEAHIRMVSPIGSPTGVQITREACIRSGSSRLGLHLTFTNIADHSVRWSIWDVVQLRADRLGPDDRLIYEPGCVITAPANPRSRFPAGYNVMFGAPDNPQWRVDRDQGLFVGTYRFEIGKVGLDSCGGWIAFANTATGYAFVERFTVEPDGEYPDATASFDIEWGACRCDGPVLAVTDAGCVSRRLTATSSNGQVALTGTFGVFDIGELDLVWLADGGAMLAGERLGPVTPLALVQLKHHSAPPATAASLRLDVVAPSGQRRALASAQLPGK
jgi:hypothetical protein